LKKDQELQTLTLSRQRVIITLGIIALISVLIIAVLLINRYRVMNRTKRLLEIEKVRNNIARDLHDDMGSALSSINILSQVALVEKNGNTQTYLQRIGDQSARMMEEMGDMVWSINPRNDSMSQVLIRMREFASEIFELKNIEYLFTENGIEKLMLNAEQRKNLFLIFKESINNTAKYSEASRVEVSLYQSNHKLKMSIKDNGRGFDEQTIKAGNGLRNLRERAKEINATLHVQSAIGKGTEVELTIPIA
jgi:two-component system, NarL family, sensor histidine kinase UhpB